MYSTGATNFPIPIPPPNYCVQGNIPFQQSFAPTFYPPAAPPYNYYQNTAHYNGPNPGGNNIPPIHNFNPTQPPPGYAVNGTHIIPNTSIAAPSYQPVHMANVCSPSFNGFRAPNASTVCNQFRRPPPTIPKMNDMQKITPNRFTHNGNNRRVLDTRNSPYFCEACDKGFISLGKFTQHKSEHVTCGQEGCTFSAHSKIVEKHFLMQHRSGLFKRIVKGNSPEEIQKWISERKKHFPTKEKIEVRQAQKEEMVKRGERYAERKRQFNQRNPNFKSGSNNRYDKNTPNRNGQFKSRMFGNRRNASRIRTDSKNRPENKRKDLALNEDENCSLRNVPPFKGTVYYQNVENNSTKEYKEHIISDDEDISILSGDDDDVTVIDYNGAMSNEKVISELEKSSGDLHVRDDSEKDCLNKYFLNCDTVDENGEEPDDCDKTDTNDSTTETTNPSVTHSDKFEQPINDKKVSNAVGSLALIQCYGSDISEDEDDTTTQNNCKTNPSLLNKIISKSNYSTEVNKLDKSSSKNIPIEKNNGESNSSPLKIIETEKTNDSSDNSEPEEHSSKPVPFESSGHQNMLDCQKNNDKEPAACPSECAVVAEGDIPSSKDDETKGCESKKRKRKRRRDSKSEIEVEEESDKKPEDKLPPVLRFRKRYKPPTLLEKLLSNEIKHERNVVLQCIRHVVNNDYFKVGESNSS